MGVHANQLFYIVGPTQEWGRPIFGGCGYGNYEEAKTAALRIVQERVNLGDSWIRVCIAKAVPPQKLLKRNSYLFRDFYIPKPYTRFEEVALLYYTPSGGTGWPQATTLFIDDNAGRIEEYHYPPKPNTKSMHPKPSTAHQTREDGTVEHAVQRSITSPRKSKEEVRREQEKLDGQFLLGLKIFGLLLAVLAFFGWDSGSWDKGNSRPAMTLTPAQSEALYRSQFSSDEERLEIEAWERDRQELNDLRRDAPRGRTRAGDEY